MPSGRAADGSDERRTFAAWRGVESTGDLRSRACGTGAAPGAAMRRLHTAVRSAGRGADRPAGPAIGVDRHGWRDREAARRWLPRRRVRPHTVTTGQRPRRPRRLGSPTGGPTVATLSLTGTTGSTRLRAYGSTRSDASTTRRGQGRRRLSSVGDYDHLERAFVQVTSVGHAGFRIDTRAGSILCDPWVQPGVLRLVVPVPGQQPAGLGRPRRLRLPLRLAPAQGPLRPARTAPSTSTRTPSCCCPDFPVPDLRRELEKLGLPPVLRDHRLASSTASAGPRATST